MNKNTFKHGKFYKITRYGRINLNFMPNGKSPFILDGKGEPVWFVGLAWKATYLKSGYPQKYVPENNTPFYIIASNYYEGANIIYVEHNEKNEYKKYWVKTIEPITLKEFPLLIGTKTTTLFDRFLKGDIPEYKLKYNGYIFGK